MNSEPMEAAEMEGGMSTEFGKRWLTPAEAVEEGYFTSQQTAANLRAQKRGPRYHKPLRGRVVYAREDLEAWIRKGVILTVDSLPRRDAA